MRVETLGAVLGALYAAHHVADHWVQTSYQAKAKGHPGWRGRLTCTAHIATYTATLGVALGAIVVAAGASLHPGWVAAGLTVSAVTHYYADRRYPLQALADRVRLGGFWRLGAPRPGRDDNPSLGTGAYALDQSWHLGWLFVSALLMVQG